MASRGPDLDEVNPYDGRPELSKLEAEVLWEYAKLAKNVKTLLTRTRELSADQVLLGKLRVLERKMGFVLTLFKASVWAAINDRQQDEDSYDHDRDITQDEAIDRTVTQ